MEVSLPLSVVLTSVLLPDQGRTALSPAQLEHATKIVSDVDPGTFFQIHLAPIIAVSAPIMLLKL